MRTQVMDTACLSPTLDISRITSIWQENAEFSPDKTSLSLTLSWTTSNNPSDPIDHCNIYSSTIIGDQDSSTSSSSWQSEFVFLGRAYATSFRVKDLYILSADLNEAALSLEFHVQPVTMSRWKLAVQDSPGLIIKILP